MTEFALSVLRFPDENLFTKRRIWLVPDGKFDQFRGFDLSGPKLMGLGCRRKAEPCGSFWHFTESDGPVLGRRTFNRDDPYHICEGMLDFGSSKAHIVV